MNEKDQVGEAKSRISVLLRCTRQSDDHWYIRVFI